MRIWGFVIVFALATLAGVLMARDPGYALFSYGEWTLEMPLWLAVLSILLIALGLWFFLTCFNWIFNTPKRFWGWRQRRKLEASRKNTARGLLELAEGQYEKAERYLTKGAQNSEVPLINYLSAAKAAEEEGATERRDHYLAQALDVSAGAEIAVKLTESKLKFEHGELEDSERVLLGLLAEYPKHPEVLKQLAIVQEAMGHWQSLYMLLPRLRKAKVFHTQENQEQFEQRVYTALLPEISAQGPKSLLQFWKQAPNSVKGNTACIKIYCRLLMQHGMNEAAENLLRSSLNKGWQEDLGQLYGLVEGPSSKKQLSYLESFIHHQPDSSVLFLSLGRLALRNQLWGKARDYLEQSAHLKPTSDVYALLGDLMDQLGQPEKRTEYLKRGLNFATQQSQENA